MMCRWASLCLEFANNLKGEIICQCRVPAGLKNNPDLFFVALAIVSSNIILIVIWSALPIFDSLISLWAKQTDYCSLCP